MAHMMKMPKAAAGHMLSHYARSEDIEKSACVVRSNENINPEKTFLNYNLACADQPQKQIDFLHQRLSEVKVLSRKDVNVMVDWVITIPKPLNNEDVMNRETFFREAYEFLNHRYGKENVVSAYVHLDEVTPHMHYAFIPVVQDKKKGGFKLSAKEAVTRQDLKTFHRDLSNHMEHVFGLDIGILNEATKEGNRSIEELKRGTARAELEDIALKTRNLLQNEQELRRGIEILLEDKNSIQGKIEALEKKLNGIKLKLEEISRIQPKKTFTGAIKGVTVEDIENLKSTAIMATSAVSNAKELVSENKELKERVKNLESKMPSVMDEFKWRKEKTMLLEKAKAFDRLPDDIKRQVLPRKKSKSINYER